MYVVRTLYYTSVRCVLIRHQFVFGHIQKLTKINTAIIAHKGISNCLEKYTNEEAIPIIIIQSYLCSL